ncbi:Protein C08H9.3 a, partial [Aphelenchoides avenae]
VHRNWMAVTHNLPLREWYFNNVSEWTLDYPPFFAYFEKALSLAAQVTDPEMLVLQEQPYFSETLLLFHRVSVIVTDMLYVSQRLPAILLNCPFQSLGSVFLAEAVVSSLPLSAAGFKLRMKFGLFVLLAVNPGLILLDNIHFQYNSMLFGIFCVAVAAVYDGCPLTGALLFSTLLNFKHIYLYYVPAFVAYYLVVFVFRDVHVLPVVRLCTTLATAVLLPLAVSFGPFVAQGGLSQLEQILKRLFPFKRGLTHAYWAPNFWALYNAVDYMLYKVLRRLAVTEKCDRLLKCPVPVPTYTTGLVEEYGHSILPDITPAVALGAVLFALSPLFLLYRTKNQHKLLAGVVLSSYAFFLFGWHVHEKAVLMISIPMTALAFTDLRFLESFVLLTMTSLSKYGLASAYMIIVCTTLHYVLRISPRELFSRTNAFFLVAFVALELYKAAVHSTIFRGGADFLPLMMTSILCSLAVHLSYISVLANLVGADIVVAWKKRCCLCRERTILANESKHPFVKEEDIRFVGGLDISVYKEWDIGVVSYTVVSYPSLEVVFSSDEVVLVTNPYVPEYLALREAEILAGMVDKHRDVPVDVILIDGNGKYHGRGCGLACHVGYLSKRPTIGVSKNFNAFPLLALGQPRESVEKFEK